jgi:hypothetical protein
VRRYLPLLALVACDALAQCVMCGRTAAAQNASRAAVLNSGIVVLGIPPVLILAVVLFLAWRRNTPE